MHFNIQDITDTKCCSFSSTVPAFILFLTGWPFTSRSNWRGDALLSVFRLRFGGSTLPKVSASSFDHYKLENPRCWFTHRYRPPLSRLPRTQIWLQICFVRSQIFWRQYTSIHKHVTVCVVSVFPCTDVCVLASDASASEICMPLLECVCVSDLQSFHLSLSTHTEELSLVSSKILSQMISLKIFGFENDI